MKTISAADANRQFSRILREVANGDTVVVTSRGNPVVRIESVRPTQTQENRTARQEAWKAHIARLRMQPSLGLGRITRDEIYED